VFCKCPPDAARNCKQTWRSFARELGPAISGAFDADSYRTRIEMIPGGVQETRRRGTAGSGRRICRTRCCASSHTGGIRIRTCCREKSDQSQGVWQAAGGRTKADRKNNRGIQREAPPSLRVSFHAGRREMQGRIKQASRETLGLAVEHLLDDVRAAQLGSAGGADLPG
jgi:hypothetical protein